MDRYAARCVNVASIVTRMAVQRARSALGDTGYQPRAAPGYSQRSPWLIVSAVASLAVGCAGSSSTPTAPSPDQLTGTWNLLSIQPVGQAEQPTPSGARYTLSFSDGRLSTRVDCNTCTGGFALAGETLTAGPALACTRAACPTMVFENIYTGLLSGDSTMTLVGDTLALSSPRGVLRFTR
jgi:heat shock protein HslJ